MGAIQLLGTLACVRWEGGGAECAAKKQEYDRKIQWQETLSIKSKENARDGK